MHLLPIDQLKVAENRYRKSFTPEKLAEMKQSLLTVGLIHLPVIRQVDGHAFIVAGERRSRAIRELFAEGKTFKYHHQDVPLGMFPCALFEELDPLLAKEIELEENTIRVDLTWQERAEAVKELHELRTKQNPAWTMTDTAEEVTGHRSNPTAVVRNRVLLAENMHRPEVKSAPDEKTAYKALTKVLQAEFEAELGKRVVVQSSEYMVKCCDALKGIRELPPGSIDVILTDPPYGVGADNFDAEMLTTHDYDDSWSTVSGLMLRLASATYSVAAEQAHLYLFCDVLHFLELKQLFSDGGWDVWPRPLIWVKDVGHIPRPNHGPKRTYECILYALKGDKMVTALYDDVIQCPAVKKEAKVHAAQKPVELYVNLLRRSTKAGDKVLDPFCGSGTIFDAAKQLKLQAVGFDLDPASVAKAQERIK